ncbi:MAG: hypothetical protein WD767_01950 [Alphaproteobacteria bacterium]
MGLFEPDVRHGRGHGETHLIPRGPAITVISPAQAAAAVSAAAALARPLTLISAPDAASSVGPVWFAALVDDARAGFPDTELESILDCGDAPGHALAALRIGFRTIRFDGPAAARIIDIARQYNACVIPVRPESLDLQAIEASGRDVGTACTDWLNPTAGS